MTAIAILILALMLWTVGALFVCGMTASNLEQSEEELEWEEIGRIFLIWPYVLARLIS